MVEHEIDRQRRQPIGMREQAGACEELQVPAMRRDLSRQHIDRVERYAARG